SSFIFNGDVKELQLKGIGSSNSYIYVKENFGKDGQLIKPMGLIDSGPRLRLPKGMHFKNTRLTNNLNHSINPNKLRILDNSSTSPTLLNRAISPFELVITQQDLQLNTSNAEA